MHNTYRARQVRFILIPLAFFIGAKRFVLFRNQHSYALAIIMDCDIQELVQSTMEAMISKAESILRASEKHHMSNKKGVRAKRRDVMGCSLDKVTIGMQECDEMLDLDDLQAARAHWIQLFKINMQVPIVYNTFFYLLKKFEHIRPLWRFSRNITGRGWCKEILKKDSRFVQHCNNVQAAINMIMENVDDVETMNGLIQQLGAHHFFYEAYEPHFEVLHHSFMESMRRTLYGTAALDERLERAWNTIFEMIKCNMSNGVAAQRHCYMSQCITPKEMAEVSVMWEQVKTKHVHDVGSNICQLALQIYNRQIEEMKFKLPVKIEGDSETLQQLSLLIIGALETTFQSYNDENGFADLPNRLQPFVHRSLVLEVCPAIMGKAFTEALTKALTSVLGITTMNDATVQTWNKIARVFEQAVTSNIVNY